MAGIGLFVGEILLGGGDCGLTGLLGLCQKDGRENVLNIDRLNQYASVLTDYVLRNFFLITNELEEIQKTQTEMQKKSKPELENRRRAI